jgi:hypothetical protein
MPTVADYLEATQMIERCHVADLSAGEIEGLPIEGHQPPCDAGDRRALGHTSASHDPYRHREAEVGSPSKSGTAIPPIIVLMLNDALINPPPVPHAGTADRRVAATS